jgi:hypothetical protein
VFPIIARALLVLLIAVPAVAQIGPPSALWPTVPIGVGGQLPIGVGGQSKGGVSSGPGDIVSSAKVWFGLRAYSVADRGNKLINICDAAGANCEDWSSSLTTGRLVNQIVGSTDCTAVNTCQVKTLYDRSGALSCGGAVCDVTNATANQRPTLTWSCLNSLPCLVFSGTTILLTNATGFTQAQNYTVSTMMNRTSGTGPGEAYLSATNANFFGFRNTAANTVQIFGGLAAVTVGSITDANWHTFQVLFGQNSSTLLCGGLAGSNCSPGGTLTTGLNIGGNGMGGALTVGGPSGSAVAFEMTEIGIWAGTLTATQQTNLAANQAAFYGTF